ncbi:hypothetical protein [Mesorhizobium sp. L48C026A00]|uniref:hypothetical protein n=1 Tax=Mesorhizobium sp. L48C026A00 TaxID=1287182 RepID=UPI0003CF6472|nr:hypothetical protein [Mesorhizobium sp. L48C026A00]ESY77195.1 hypothetical protein X739_33250 [Mesorhizobium sp. LNHC220B00]
MGDDLRQETMALLVADGISFSFVCLPDERAGTEVVALWLPDILVEPDENLTCTPSPNRCEGSVYYQRL